ncbi:hypothetical protein J6590_005111 [Homalodisca vitripennis]|nr:hypothetical protein J6590_005111 [Homalodisca vitripennis]
MMPTRRRCSSQDYSFISTGTFSWFRASRALERADIPAVEITRTTAPLHVRHYNCGRHSAFIVPATVNIDFTLEATALPLESLEILTPLDRATVHFVPLY